jgi:leader peptidase (prepilin peptidase) / N-methyltransferase
MPEGFYLGVTVFLGLCFGSLATALSWRIPRGISVSVERSKCPSCHHSLGIPDLVPVFSWLALRGRCRFCKAPIGWRYPLIELATLLLCLALYARFGFSVPVLLMFCLAPVIVAAADIDFAFQILPDSLNIAIAAIAAAVIGANAALVADSQRFLLDHGLEAFEGAVLYGGSAAALRWGAMLVLKKDPMGWGDIKFFAAAGFWLGTNLMVYAYFLFAAGVLGVVIALVWKRIKKEAEFPFGPALLAAFVLMLMLAPPPFILQEYVNLNLPFFQPI